MVRIRKSTTNMSWGRALGLSWFLIVGALPICKRLEDNFEVIRQETKRALEASEENPSNTQFQTDHRPTCPFGFFCRFGLRPRFCILQPHLFPPPHVLWNYGTVRGSVKRHLHCAATPELFYCGTSVHFPSELASLSVPL